MDSANSSVRSVLTPTIGLMVGSWVLGGWAASAIAHGAIIEVTRETRTIEATFDNGDPIANAQVLIYSPDNLEKAWKKGETDKQGRFSFEPDGEVSGQWEVTVRQAGHGGTTTFEVGDSEGTKGENSSFLASPAGAQSNVQKWISMAAIIWGFVGTALFFSRKSASSETSSEPSSGSASANTSGGEA